MENKLKDNAMEMSQRVAEMTGDFNEKLIYAHIFEKEDMRISYDKEKDMLHKKYGIIILSLIITLAILISGVIGGIIYVLGNYEFETYQYEQEVSDGGHANAITGDSNSVTN